MAITALTDNTHGRKRHGLFHHRPSDQDQRASITNFAPITMLMGYKGLTKDRDHFLILKDPDDGYAELLSIQGQGIASMPPRQQAQLIAGFRDYLRAMVDDCKFLISPFPADTSEQRAYTAHLLYVVGRQMKQTHNQRLYRQLATRHSYLKGQLQRLIQVEKQHSNQEFICALFNRHRRDLRNLRDNAIVWGGSALRMDKISAKKKEQIIFRINNLNTRIR